MAVFTLKTGEAIFGNSAVKVTLDDSVGEAAPVAVGPLKSILPDTLDGLVVRFQHLVKRRILGLPRSIDRKLHKEARRNVMGQSSLLSERFICLLDVNELGLRES